MEKKKEEDEELNEIRQKRKEKTAVTHFVDSFFDFSKCSNRRNCKLSQTHFSDVFLLFLLPHPQHESFPYVITLLPYLYPWMLWLLCYFPPIISVYHCSTM